MLYSITLFVSGLLFCFTEADKDLFEGDIVIDKNDPDVNTAQQGNEKRNAQRTRARLWNTKTVPYVTDQSFLTRKLPKL